MAIKQQDLSTASGRKMINKKNWKLTKLYFSDRLHGDQLSMSSLKVEETYLRYLLIWADNVPFSKVPSVIPTFPEYMRTARLDNGDSPLSATHIKKILSAARRFLLWLYEYNKEFRSLKISWINKIKAKRLTDTPQTKEFVSLEEILIIAKTPTENTMERRTKASCILMFLSGMRIGALVTLPLKAVDIENRIILQYPSLGVHTKNRKPAKTFLFPIPELLEALEPWDKEVRSLLSEEGFWFAPLSPETGEIDKNNTLPNDTRVALLRKNMKDWFQKNGIPYHSPHKFRHGHVHYGQAHSKTQEDYKAVSQNVMHSTTGITDQFYSNLDDHQQKERIDSLFNRNTPSPSDNDLFREFQEFQAWKRLKSNDMS